MIEISTIMTKNVVTASPDMSIQEAIISLSSHDFNGLPVVDNNGKLIGLFSEKNMLSDEAYVHLRTLLKLFSEMEYYKKDYSMIKDELKNVVNLKVGEVMNPHPVVAHPTDSIDDAKQLFYSSDAYTLPIVNDENKLVGVLSTSDFTKFYGVPMARKAREKDVNREIDNFVREFEKKFIIVSRFNAKIWMITSILFTLIGFAIAMFFILRISVRT